MYPPPPWGGWLGWGIERRGTKVTHIATPTPSPSPQGGGEEFAAASRLGLVARLAPMESGPKPAARGQASAEPAAWPGLDSKWFLIAAPLALGGWLSLAPLAFLLWQSFL